jgi:16S rRNA (uracil1498-N3)-methyltransferase
MFAETPASGVHRRGAVKRPAATTLGHALVSRYDFRSPRLYVEDRLSAGATVELGRKQAHYLRNVLRHKQGNPVLLFNGKDGEWRAVSAEAGKGVRLKLEEQTRPQAPAADLHLLFAPLKHERLDYMVQKAVEMGVSKLQPVLTQHTQVSRVNTERMSANVIEAAEQCGILSIPDVGAPQSLNRVLAARSPDRLLVFCDENADVANPVAALSAARTTPNAMLPLTMGSDGAASEPIAVLTGPEGGFAEEERAALLKLPNIVRLSLGPRILRADTAAVAALAVVQAVLGDWK